MRRFQCIKTMSDAFTAGRSYWVHEPSEGYERAIPDGTCFIDNQGDIDEVTPDGMMAYFQELPELSEDDLEAEENRAFAESAGGFVMTCALSCVIVGAATIGLIWWLTIVWRS